MPHPNWTHTCRKTGRTKRDWKPFRCWRCFGQADFAGWSSSVVEMMGDYQRLYGLICIGPHRPLADQVFAGAFTRCATCAGSGYHDDLAHRRWGPCQDCGGLGHRPAVSQADIERRRAIVLAAFPGADRSGARRHASSGSGHAGSAASASVPVACSPMTPVRVPAVVHPGSPDAWELLRATIFVLVLAPMWLFASIWTFRRGQLLVGSVLLFASAFAALCGLMTASPWSFNRRSMGVWGVLGAGFFLLLAIVTGQSACASWAEAGSRPVNDASIERSIQ